MTAKVRLSHGLRQLLADDPCSFLLYSLEQVQEQAHHRRLPRVFRHLTRRKQEIGWVHVSDLTQPCSRVLAAHLLGFQLPREPIDPKLSRIFENGTYMHLRYYNYFLSLPAPFEVRVACVLRKWPVIGEADVVVYHPEFGWQIIELKSMNEGQFKLLREPTFDHSAQVNSYVGLFPNEASGQVWYENKNTQDVKTFAAPYNPEGFQTALQRVLSVSEMVLQGQLPPPCGCNLDEYIGSLEGIEGRISELKVVKEQWQIRNRSS